MAAVLWALLLLAVLGVSDAATGNDPIALQTLQMTTDTPQVTMQFCANCTSNLPASFHTFDSPDIPPSNSCNRRLRLRVMITILHSLHRRLPCTFQ